MDSSGVQYAVSSSVGKIPLAFTAEMLSKLNVSLILF